MTEFFGGRARLVPVSVREDSRGVLLPFDFSNFPFAPCRAFTVSNVPQGTVRGGHAHKYGDQLLVCLQGRIGIVMRHQNDVETLLMEPGSPGLLVSAGVWCQQTYMTAETVLLAFASHPYDPQSYQTDWC